MQKKPTIHFGEPSWHLSLGTVEAWVTQTGGHLGPAHFRLGRRVISPLHVAPWHEEKLTASTLPIVRVLRGDFFCLPFGMNEQSYRGERHPVHGESANERWRLNEIHRSQDRLTARWDLRTLRRPGCISKSVELRQGESAIYQRHVISGMRGLMNYGHHALLRFASEGRISVSPFQFGQVYPGVFESPAAGGYTCLKAGAVFRSLERVPLATGAHADLSRYPAREGFEDVAMVCCKGGRSLGWSAVTFPQERWVWISLKDPRTLPSTLLWHSNGGRHYAPWNSRHRGVLGVEEICSYFQEGLAASARKNPVSSRGIPTAHEFSPENPLTVNTIMAVAEIPPDFDQVAEIKPISGGVRLVSSAGPAIDVAVDLSYLSLSNEPKVLKN